MSALLDSSAKSRAAVADAGPSSDWMRGLQEIATKLQGMRNFEDAIADQSQSICNLFGADRLTVYAVSEDKNALIARVKTGLTSFRDLKLPITEASIAGFCAFHKRALNIADVYDEAELKRYSQRLNFLKEVDKRTGYRTKQMLVAPIMHPDDPKSLLGVIQMINNRGDQPFSSAALDQALELAKLLAPMVINRGPITKVRTKYDALVTDGVISAGELELANRTARRKGKDVEDILTEEFQVKPAAIGKSLSAYFGVPYEAFKPDRMKPMDLLRNIKREYAETNQWLPLEDVKEGLVVLAIDPERVRGSHIAKHVFPSHKLTYRVTTEREFVQTLDQFFGDAYSSASIGEMLSNLEEDAEEGAVTPDELSAASENELVKFVNKVILDAHSQGVSDIHIEPYPGKNKTEIRFRRDGSMYNYIEVPASYRSPLVTRLKIMCDLDISEKRKPQDGKIKFKKFGPLDIELRVATIPTAGGLEDVVMRILASGEPLPLDKIGLSPRNLEKLKDIISKPYGAFFCCGPTGSGKTTTLHSVLAALNDEETKIWTAEDPVEITQKGLRQVQMNNKAGLNFATAMRAFLRADPDVIMVGEMRDKETVSIGVEASLTGHLVLSTLHTNSAPESIVRLLDMGMDPFNFADAMLGVLAQRLAKRLCPKCKKPHVASQEEIKRLLTEYCEELQNLPEWKKDQSAGYKKIYEEWGKQFANQKGEFTLYEKVGCDACNNSGYKGRVGLHELLVGTDAVKRDIQNRARVADMLVTALNEGMRTLKQDGIEKVLQGITDMAQVRAVCIK